MSTGQEERRRGGGQPRRRSLRTLAWDRHVVLGLWYLTVYLLVLYVTLRWGHRTGSARFPGSD